MLTHKDSEVFLESIANNYNIDIELVKSIYDTSNNMDEFYIEIYANGGSL